MSWPAHSYNAEMEARLGIWVNQGLPGLWCERRYARSVAEPDDEAVSTAGADANRLQHGAARCSREASRVPGANATECPSMTTSFKQFIADESGATAIEYGLIAAAFRSRSLPS
jgi:hypothetical protein